MNTLQTWSLKKLLLGIIVCNDIPDCSVSGLALDSRNVKKGDVFFAYPGLTSDGRKFIDDAIANGAVAIVAESDQPIKNVSVPLILTSSLQKNIGKIAARFYGNPADKMTMIGVTGTNGKTTCTQLIARCLEKANIKCAVIGTMGVGFPDSLSDAALTTPDPILLQKQLAQFHHEGAEAVSMEVSSHSLEQNRISGMSFQVGIFTNLSRDHLDYHQNMEAYFNAKCKLFTDYNIKTAIINIDDKYGRELLEKLTDKINVITYAIQNEKADVRASDVKLTDKGIQAVVHTPWGKGDLQSHLLGRFNLSNLIAIVACASTFDISLDTILTIVKTLPRVNGRMQAFGGVTRPLVVVDYSHTPDALAQALQALKEHCKGELWCVFGCGGERDSGKRPQMGQMAECFADKVVITNDNPRHEDPEKIVVDIKAGLSCPQDVKVELDRLAAIEYVLSAAKPGDIVLVAGRGHEAYQQIGDKKLMFSDAKVIEGLLK